VAHVLFYSGVATLLQSWIGSRYGYIYPYCFAFKLIQLYYSTKQSIGLSPRFPLFSVCHWSRLHLWTFWSLP